MFFIYENKEKAKEEENADADSFIGDVQENGAGQSSNNRQGGRSNGRNN